MARFLLTAQLQLAAPTNVGSVVRQIQSQLNGVNVNVGVRGAVSATKQMNSLSKSTNAAANSAERLGASFGKAIKRFAAFSIATRAVSLMTQGLGGAVAEAISFERELIKVSQVTGKTMRELKGLSNTVRQLSVDLGVSSKELLSVARILAQTGLSARETEIALTALAKTELAPTFENITQTAEGAVAIINQFKQGVEALEEQLGAINAVAGQFAVEAGDLIAVIRRTGGVFKSAGGDLNELIALFTSVRATTRESAESIATGLRTIFTRIQRPKTIEFLKEMGIELLDLEGRFVGPYEAVRRLNAALVGLKPGDLKFIEIAEQLGGFRQIGKVLPLLQEFAVAEEARAAAMAGSNSLTDDAATAQAALSVRVTALKEQFLELMDAVVQSPTFMIMANAAIALAENLMKIADALKHLIPLLVTLAAIKLTQGMMGFMGGLKGGMGGGGMKFARGGLVPGSGNRDTIPATLTPGEFVIRKQSVAAIGADRLQQMNRYAAGGKVSAGRHAYGGIRDFGVAVLGDPDKNKQKSFSIGKASGDVSLNNGMAFTDARVLAFVTKAMKKYNLSKTETLNVLSKSVMSKGAVGTMKHSGPTDPGLLQKFRESINEGLIEGIDFGSQRLASRFEGVTARKTPPHARKRVLEGLNNAAVGNAFEDILDNLSGDPYDTRIDPKRPFDFTNGMGGAAALFPLLSGRKYIEAKGSWPAAEWASMFGKIINQLGLTAAVDPSTKGLLESAGAKKGSAKKKGAIAGAASVSGGGGAGGGTALRATGGGVYGTDTVPALLTPGEFVVNKQSAQSIGYANLSKMNRYAAGGRVSAGRHAYGGTGQLPLNAAMSGGGGGGGGSEKMKKMEAALLALNKAIEKTAGILVTPFDANLEKTAGVLLTPFNTNLEKTATLMVGEFMTAFTNIASLLEGAFRTALVGTEKPLQALMADSGAVAGIMAGSFREALLAGARGAFAIGRAGRSAVKSISAIGAAAGTLKSQMKMVGSSMKTAGKSGKSLQAIAEAAPLVAQGLRSMAEFAPLAATALQNLKVAVGAVHGVFTPMMMEAGSALATAFQTFAGRINTIGTALTQFKTALKNASKPPPKQKAGNKGTQALQVFVEALVKTSEATMLFAQKMLQLGAMITAALTPMAELMVAMGLLSKEDLKLAMDTAKLDQSTNKLKADEDKLANTTKKAAGGMMAMLGPLMAVEMLLGMVGSKLDEVESTAGRFGAAMVKGISVFVMLVMIMSMLNIEAIGELWAKAKNIVATTTEATTRWAVIMAMRKEIKAKMTGGMGVMLFAAAIMGAIVMLSSFTKATKEARIEAAKKQVEEGTMTGEEYGEEKRGAEKAAMIAFGVGLVLLTIVIIVAMVAIGIAISPLIIIGAIILVVIGAFMALVGAFSSVRDLLAMFSFGLMSTTEQLDALAHHEGMVLEAEKKSKDAKEHNTKVMKDLTAGTISAVEAMNQFSRAGIATAGAVLEARKRLIEADKGEFSYGREIMSFFNLMDSNEEKNAAIDKQHAGDLAKEQGALFNEIRAMNPILAEKAKEMILADSGTAASKQEFLRQAQEDAGPEFNQLTGDQRVKLRKEWEDTFDNLQESIERNIKKYAAMNFQLRASESAINLATIRMNEFTSSLEVGFLPLESSLNTLQSVLEQKASAISDIEIAAAIADVLGAMKSFGGDTTRLDVFGDTIKGFNLISQHFESNATKIMEKLKQQGENFNLEDVEKLYKEEMRAVLSGSGISDEAVDRIMDTIQLTKEQKEALASGDTSVLEELTEEQRKNVQEQLEQVRKIVELQKVVVDLTKEKVKMERMALTAEKKAIDLRMEAARIISKHGGKAVTGADKRKAILDKANVGAGKMGLASMGTGSIAEIRQRNAQIMGNFSTAEAGGRRVGGAGGFEGPAGVEGAGRRDDLMKAQQDHVKMIRDLIKVEEEELKLIEKKNELEKKSLEQLLKGDLEGFLKDQAAVGATAAIATGSAGLMGLFGAEALGGAFTNIQSQANAGQQSLFGQQLQGSGGLMERAGGAALSARGMGGDRAAQMLAGTGAEAEAKRKNIRGLAGELGAAGQTGVDMAQMQVNTAKINISEAQIIVNKAITDAATPNVINKAAGGLIYASNGMFVPRGSDTVPAMLTPGEFVVNRAAVNRGNNLQLLRAMNGTARGYAEGGPVGYYSRGSRDRVRGGGVGLDATAMQSFTTALNSFNSNLTENLDRLERSAISIKLDATNVTVKLDGGNFLASLRDELKRELLAEISNQMGNQSFSLAGDSGYDPSTLPS